VHVLAASALPWCISITPSQSEHLLSRNIEQVVAVEYLLADNLDQRVITLQDVTKL
jgi:hypothetical protein